MSLVDRLTCVGFGVSLLYPNLDGPGRAFRESIANGKRSV
jgi:hypothetical protein